MEKKTITAEMWHDAMAEVARASMATNQVLDMIRGIEADARRVTGIDRASLGVVDAPKK